MCQLVEENHLFHLQEVLFYQLQLCVESRVQNHLFLLFQHLVLVYDVLMVFVKQKMVCPPLPLSVNPPSLMAFSNRDLKRHKPRERYLQDETS